MLIKSLGANYPIINQIGFAPAKLIMLVIGGQQIQLVCRILENISAPYITEFMSPSTVKNVLYSTNSENVIFLYSTTRKGKNQLHFLNTFMQFGGSEDQRLGALAVLVSERNIWGSEREKLFCIYLPLDLSNIDIPLDYVVPPDEQIAVVMDRIRNLELAGKSQEEKALLAAACFIYPYLVNTEKDGEFDDLLNLASELVRRDENNQYTEKLGQLFIEEIYKWQERSSFQDVYQLPNLEMKIEQNLDKFVLFDGQYIYMKEQLFAEIVQSLLEVFSLDFLKSALVEEGILCPENTRTYTSKMGYRNIIGDYRRERMLRLKRDRLNRAGEMEFIDICLNQRGDMGDD